MIADADTIATNLAAARRFVEGVLGGTDPAAFAEIVHPDVVVDTGLKVTGKIRGAAEYGRVLGEAMGTAFADGRMQIEDIAALVDGRVIVRFEASAENVGALNGVPATGRRFTFCELHLMRFEDGKLIENWVGALNPLMFELWQAPATAPSCLEAIHEDRHSRRGQSRYRVSSRSATYEPGRPSAWPLPSARVPQSWRQSMVS